MRILGTVLLIGLFACGDSPVQIMCEPESLTIWTTQEANPDVCPGADPGALESAQVEDDRVAAVTVDGDRLVITGMGQGSTGVTVQTSNAGTVSFTVTVNEALETVLEVCEVGYDEAGEQHGFDVRYAAAAMVDLTKVSYRVSVGTTLLTPQPISVGDMKAGQTLPMAIRWYRPDGNYGNGVCKLHIAYVVAVD